MIREVHIEWFLLLLLVLQQLEAKAHSPNITVESSCSCSEHHALADSLSDDASLLQIGVSQAVIKQQQSHAVGYLSVSRHEAVIWQEPAGNATGAPQSIAAANATKPAPPDVNTSAAPTAPPAGNSTIPAKQNDSSSISGASSESIQYRIPGTMWLVVAVLIIIIILLLFTLAFCVMLERERNAVVKENSETDRGLDDKLMNRRVPLPQTEERPASVFHEDRRLPSPPLVSMPPMQPVQTISPIVATSLPAMRSVTLGSPVASAAHGTVLISPGSGVYPSMTAAGISPVGSGTFTTRPVSPSSGSPPNSVILM
jgi:hypothetical protein